MSGLRFEDVQGRTGSCYSVSGTGLSLTLDKTEELPVAHGREGGSFRLEFVGPIDPVLPQAIYALADDAAAHEIFLVPIARDAAGTRYEAVFN